MPRNLSIDVFCRVIDFFGDIGVCWRLVRQLHEEFDCIVRLIVDDFTTFKRIAPALAPDLQQQALNGITILRWDDVTLEAHYKEASDVVIEAFACSLPDSVIAKIKVARPIWIDLEYLSAEAWVEECHAIPSWHPATGVEKALFFPGFTASTGGLPRERALIARRDAFQSDSTAQNRWRERHGLPPLERDVTDLSLFCYRQAPLRTLMGAIDKSTTPVRLFVTGGVDEEAVRATGLDQHPSFHRVQFLSQEDYDHLLWTCSANFVRGEDSLVRAIWAEKPLVWHIYPQENAAHLVKLEAFMRLYSSNLPPESASSLYKFAHLWNVRGRSEEDRFLSQDQDWILLLNQVSSDLGGWSENLLLQRDLASQLIDFIRQQKSQQESNVP
jgi:uncharacterized repeat protein (TIGR03837 family)